MYEVIVRKVNPHTPECNSKYSSGENVFSLIVKDINIPNFITNVLNTTTPENADTYSIQGVTSEILKFEEPKIIPL